MLRVKNLFVLFTLVAAFASTASYAVSGASDAQRSEVKQNISDQTGVPVDSLGSAPTANAAVAKASAKVSAVVQLLKAAGVENLGQALSAVRQAIASGIPLDTALTSADTFAGLGIDAAVLDIIASAMTSVVASINSISDNDPNGAQKAAETAKTVANEASAIVGGETTADDLANAITNAQDQVDITTPPVTTPPRGVPGAIKPVVPTGDTNQADSPI